MLDLRTGMSALTTNTGTLSLFFVDTAGTLIRIAKLGYEPQSFFVANALTNTAGPAPTHPRQASDETPRGSSGSVSRARP